MFDPAFRGCRALPPVEKADESEVKRTHEDTRPGEEPAGEEVPTQVERELGGQLDTGEESQARR